MTYSIKHTLVFAHSAQGGNPCSIILNADSLTDTQHRQLAQQWGYECSFVHKPTIYNADFRLRFFAPNHELAMCVHGTVGATYALLADGQVTQSPVRMQIGEHMVPVHWRREEGQYKIEVEQAEPVFGELYINRHYIADILGIPGNQLLDSLPLQSVSTGRSKLLIPVRDEATLHSVTPQFEAIWTYCDQIGSTGFYLFAPSENPIEFDYQTRQFPNRVGYDEDPATGVAASALAAYLSTYETNSATSGWRSYRIGQGFAMGKPCRMTAAAFKQDGEIRMTRVGGEARLTGEESRSL